jgi:glycosyltransferase involved in cell wall biosynthesis
MNSLVSIIVPCYEQAQYLAEALQSILDQTYTDWECIVVNDGSKDNTEEIAKLWMARDDRFKYIYQDNRGLSSARNTGIIKAQGEFILPLDADDKIAKDYIFLAIDAFKKDSSLKLVYCKAEKFGDEMGVWDLPFFSLENLARQNMIFCSALYRKQDWERVGGYDVNMIYGLEDYEFWIAVLKNGGSVCCLEKIGFYYRIKKSSMEKELNLEKKEFLYRYLSIKHSDFFVEQLGSFIYLNNLNIALKRTHDHNLKSKKFALKLFCSNFFGLNF